MPDAAIGADVMTGFPGETDADFEESRQFIEAQPFTYLHVFTYSERPGTPAAADPESIPMSVRKDRNRILRELAAAKNLAFRESMVGRTLSAVPLHDSPAALSSNYLRIQLAEPRPANALVEIPIGAVTADALAEAVPVPAQ
jgi:threonylcarbamoyladenosine tRNA methylthiotransferase MtaB